MDMRKSARKVISEETIPRSFITVRNNDTAGAGAIDNEKKKKLKKGKAAAAAEIGVKRPKKIGKKESKKKTERKALRNPLGIPEQVLRRFFLRFDCTRIASDATAPLNEASAEKIASIMKHAGTSAVIKGRTTIKKKDIEKAFQIVGIKIY